MITTKRLATICVVIMFIVSGALKVCEPFLGPFSKGITDYGRLTSRLGIHQTVDSIIVFIAGLIELAGAYLILENNTRVNIGINILVIFTIIATLIFYTFPIKFKPFLANLSVIGALWLLACK